MGKPQITVRIPPSLLSELSNYVEQTGTSKTDVVVSAIAAYLGCAEIVPLSQRMAALEAKDETGTNDSTNRRLNSGLNLIDQILNFFLKFLNLGCAELAGD